jgi:fatty-acyl-CoA synthase
VAVESKHYEEPDEVRRIQLQVAHEVFAEVDVRPPQCGGASAGHNPQDPSGKLRRAHALALVN